MKSFPPAPTILKSRGILSRRIEPSNIERLEPRIVYSIGFNGIPTWVDQGPEPINSGQVVAPVNNAVAGAIEVIAVDPADPTNTVFVGTVAGGVWRTTNFSSATPNYVPLTDNLASLYVGSIAFDPNDSDTLWVGTGSYSNTFRNQLSQSAVGLYKTTNAHAANPNDVVWEHLGAATFNNMAIRRVLPTDDPSVVLVAADNGTTGGLFRTPDGGQTWTDLSDGAAGHLPNVARGSDVIVDPNNPLRLYAAAGGSGVFESIDRGVTWTRIDNTAAPIAGIGGSGNIELAAFDGGATTVLYAGIVSSAGVLTGVFRDANGGDGVDNDGINGVDDPAEHGWAAIGAAPAIHTGSQGFNNFSVVADPTNANVVYVGGDRPPELFRGDATGGAWTSIVGAGTQSGTGPHADSRFMVFQDNTHLLEADDGGIFRLPNPLTASTSDWTNANGDLGNVEFHNISYDTSTNRVFGGSQDNGSEVQTAMGSTVWNRFLGGDGSAQAYDSVANVSYSLQNNFGTFRRGFGATQLQLRAPLGVANFDGLDADDNAFATGSSFQSYIPLATNNITANELLIGRSSLYESTDNGDHITVVPLGAGFAASDTIRSLVYGGVHNGTADDDVIYAGTQQGDLYYRDDTGTVIDRTAALTAAVGAGFVKGIATDPQDWFHVFATVDNKVAESTDAGATWTEITGNLGTLTSEIRRVAFADLSTAIAGDGAPVVGGLGGVFKLNGDGTWSEFGILPNTLVQDLIFVPADPDGNAANGTGLLVAGTFGRGAWTLPNVSANINAAPVVQINGDTDFPGENDTIRLIRNAANPQQLDIFLNNPGPTPSATVPFAALFQINVNGLGANDTLILDSTNGLISVPSGVHYDGGLGRDALQLLQTAGSQSVDTYSVGPNNGEGSSVISGPGGTQSVAFENIEPTFDNVIVPLLTINATPANNAINYSQGTIPANGLVTIDNFESLEFTNKTALTINALAGSDEISIRNANLPAALTGITIDGGDPAGSDQLTVTGTTGADAFTFVPASLTAGAVTGVVVNVNYSGTEHLVLDGDSGDDVFNLNGAGGAVSLLGSAGSDRVSFSTATEAIAFDLDAVGAAQRINTTDAIVTLLDRPEKFTGTPFNDILRVDAAPFARDLDGGPHTMVPPGDKLFFDGQGQAVAVQKTTFNSGKIKTIGYADVTFAEIESIQLDNTPSGNGGFGNPGGNSNAFADAHIYDPTTVTIGGKPAPGRSPNAVATGDLNGDGFADMVVANGSTKNISVLLNDGDGTFGEPTNFTVGGGPRDLIIKDFNGDTKLDVVVTNSAGGSVTILPGNGLGGFGPAAFIKTASSPYAVATGDLNGDTFDDLVVTLAGASSIQVLLGNGLGGFAPQPKIKSGGGKPVDIAIADFNADTKLDALVVNQSSSNVTFFQGNGAGGFSSSSKFAVGPTPTAAAVGDINGDGNLDVAVSSLAGRVVSVLLGNGAVPPVQFQPQLRLALPGSHFGTSIVLADFSGDGILDIGVGNRSLPTVTVLLGLGLGKFTQPYEFDLGKPAATPTTGGLAAADLNNDGQIDLITTSTSTSDIRVLLRNV